jgi:phosphohistidine phosphatase
MTSVPLRLDLVRHGEAVAADEHGDDARPLSAHGRDTIRRLAERFASEGWRPDAVCSSPLSRARETATILVAAAHPGLEIETLEALTPDHDPEDVVAALAPRGLRGHVVLVGHQPLLGRLVTWLVGSHDGGFPPGALCRFEVEGGLAPLAARLVLELRPDPS